VTLARGILGAAIGSTALLLAGCAVGPDFERPAAPAITGYTPDPLPARTAATDGAGGESQTFAMGEAVAGEWWTLFESPALNTLVAQALKNNPSLQEAQASLRQADEILAAQYGLLYPSVDGNFSLQRQKSFGAFGGGGGAASIPAYTITTASVSVSYGLDIFGIARRTVESTTAQAEVARFQMEAAYLTLTSNVVAAAVQQAALREQIAATQDILDAQNQQRGVLRRQLELGGIPEAELLQQESAVAQTRATLPPLQKQLAQTTNQLLALVGRFPSEDLGDAFDLAALKLPRELPVSLPSRLVEQRPDIRASEAALHAASAQIGVATASMLPQLTLNGNYGTSASRVEDLFSAGTGIWSIGANVLQPLFHGGELLHKRRAAVAAYDAAAARYRGTVLGAFQNVADVLRALELDAEALNAQVTAERAAATNLDIARQQLQIGGTSFLTFLDAQRIHQQARIALVQAQANRYADTAALFVALGGGWWNRPDATVANNTAE